MHMPSGVMVHFARADPAAYAVGMWQEYTRESPARRGLGVATAALVLAGTTTLAWVMARQPITLREESLANWPIRFSVPEGFARLYDTAEATIMSGESDHVTFVLGHPRAPEAILEVSYELVIDGAGDRESFVKEGTQPPGSEVSTVRIGTLEGRMKRQVDRGGKAVLLTASAVTGDGLLIEFNYTGAAHDPHVADRFRRICESVRFKEWSVPRPAVETSRPPRRTRG